jgi:glycosyltransferase involved in cell wall biosynthesis
MRIVYVLNSLGVGGAERQVLALASRMQARGHSVALMILTVAHPDDWPTDLATFHLNLSKTLFSSFSALRRAARFLDILQPDLIHSHNFHGNLLARLLHVLYRKPRVISTIHNVYEGGWMRMIAYRLTDSLASATVAVSAAAAERYIRLKAVPASKCRIFTNGIDPGEFSPDPHRRLLTRMQMGVQNEFVWLAVGRMTAAKDFPNLFEAFGLVWQAHPSTRLWIASGAKDSYLGRIRHKYTAVTSPHGALDRVKMLGLRHDMPALFDAADGFVLSSAWEGMPLALGEAMAMQKPCVATDVGGVRELAGDRAFIVAAKDSKALASAMLAVMNTPDVIREAQGRAARERICSRFNMDAKADEWELLYRSLVP